MIHGKYISAIVLAAGASMRMGTDKTSMCFSGETPLSLCVKAFAEAGADDIIITVSPNSREQAEALAPCVQTHVIIAEGGETRQESVYSALTALPERTEIVAVHDCARCLVTQEIIMRTVMSAIETGSGIAACGCRDTVFDADTLEPIDRSKLILTQTPQCFERELIVSAYEAAMRDGISATDDCTLIKRAGIEPNFVDCGIINQKLTFGSDKEVFDAVIASRTAKRETPRTGLGEDTHKLVEGRRLVLGGVEIPFELGLLGHSDADVLIHAIIDALLGAAALGDIGRHFPDSDEQYKDISSIALLSSVRGLLSKAGCRLNNIDAVVVAQRPRLAPYIDEMRSVVAQTLCVPVDVVSIKATTPEHMNDEGRLLCITARCVASLVKE